MTLVVTSAGIARREVLRALAIGAAAPMLLAACSSADADGTTDVLAAASLERLMRNAIDQVARNQPSMRARLEAGSSTTLATQIVEGRNVDLLATADATSMTAAVASGRLAEPIVLATNALVIVTPAGPQRSVRTFSDLAQPNVTLSLCDASVPCGRLADDLLSQLDLEAVAASSVREIDVRAVVTRVSSGEADAGIVYATDLMAAGDSLAEVATPTGIAVTGEVMVALARDATADAHALADLLTGPSGHRLLADLGFEPS